MNKEVKRLIEISEELGWSVQEHEEGEYLFSRFSNAGQDFNMEVTGETAEDIVDSIYSNYDNYDVSREAYLWLDDTGHGANGAPYEMRDVYDDMESCEKMMLELHDELSKRLDL